MSDTMDVKTVPEMVQRNDSETMDTSVNYVVDLIVRISNRKMREHTAADFAVRLAGSNDLWMPFQVKSCSTGLGKLFY